MLNDTGEADEVGDWLRTAYPSEFGGDKTLIIHTDKSGEISKKELEAARKAAREVDDGTSPVNVIVSVLMLRGTGGVKAMSSKVAHYVCVKTFRKALLGAAIAEQEPQLLGPDRMLSSTQPFPWSRPIYEARRCGFNLVACDNDLAFAKYLDLADDVKAFAKLPEVFGFAIDYTDGAGNLRAYYPDFVAIDAQGTNWLLETKGQETEETKHKANAATLWCENASALTSKAWKYLKVPQKEFERLQPEALADLGALLPTE